MNFLAVKSCDYYPLSRATLPLLPKVLTLFSEKKSKLWGTEAGCLGEGEETLFTLSRDLLHVAVTLCTEILSACLSVGFYQFNYLGTLDTKINRVLWKPGNTDLFSRLAWHGYL